ncbi:MAG: ATP-dependent helicase [Burkholderiaceae bacterium]
MDKGIAQLGEIDFVVLAPNGRILLIEQKTGLLEETEQGLIRRQMGTGVTVRVHVDRTLDGLSRRLAPLLQGEPLHLDYLLYCPDYRVKFPGTAGLAPERIVDSGRRDQLCTIVAQALAQPPRRAALVQRLHRFFANELDLVPDASALVGRASDLYTRLSEGLAVWARRIILDPHRLRVTATAGSGKTQLALALLEAAEQAGERAVYVCFNRPLADHMAQLTHPPGNGEAAAPASEPPAGAAVGAAEAPVQGALALEVPPTEPAPPAIRVLTYHQWCAHRVRAVGDTVDFADPDVYRWLADRSSELPVAPQERPDCLVIDEGQDFNEQWAKDLLRLAGPATRVWWLEDPMQNLYRREPVVLEGWAGLHTEVNYRSPRAVVALMNRLLRLPVPVVAGGPIPGQEPEWLVYDDRESLLTRTKTAITLAVRRGFRREDIALVTMSGRGRSALLHQARLGPHALRAFTGQYDAHGHPRYSRGDLLIDTVYRFKGQSAPCVILTEIDFEALDDQARRALFVGMSRASMHLVLVLSERAARLLDPAVAAAYRQAISQEENP